MIINIINLLKREDRYKNVLNQMHSQGISEFRIWPGIEDVNPKKGIAKAHKQIVSWAKENQLDSIIFSEDDFNFTCSNAMNYFLSREPKEYDLYLGGITYGKIDANNYVKDFSGLTLYKINSTFYETFLSLPEQTDIDRSMAGLGKFIVCNPFVVTQIKLINSDLNQFFLLGLPK